MGTKYMQKSSVLFYEKISLISTQLLSKFTTLKRKST